MIETPYVSVDGIVELFDSEGCFVGIVLISRKNPPYGWALPGGFVDIGETVEQAVCREMHEEISLEVQVDRLLGVYSDPARDPRFHTVSAVFVCRATGVPMAADDAKEVRVVSRDEAHALPLVFDHQRIMEDYLSGKQCVTD
ncbi:NUDIX hydrolase [Sulfurimonas diazotrophicus]|uniref:NUDIX hydrolase n=1 Tax=Sulfurimonas diazotrophicus TaxID=3131939 RepID=A0ABZ3HD76_9BACT